MTPWRTIETALIASIKEQIAPDDITVGPLSADIWLTLDCNDDAFAHQINLTTLAKSIADRINSEGK